MSKNNKDLKPYKTNKISNWPTGLKVFLLKAWTAGMVFYFMFMSLAVFKALQNPIDRWVIVTLVMILLNEYLINGLIKSMEQDYIIRNKHAMFIKGKWSIVFNIFYIFLVMVITVVVGGIFIGWGISLSKLFMPGEAATWEPFTFGLIYYAVDTFLVFFVWQIKKIIREKKEGDKNEVQ
ncbi:MAG: hypothetical protein ACOX56_00085 [Acholeplasmataceae bacterium]|jgi:hypothetical protein